MKHRYSGHQERTNYRESILERDHHICQVCGGEGNEVDHIIPWEVSHDRTPSNLRAICHTCNCKLRRKRKDARLPMSEWEQHIKEELAKCIT